MKWGVFFTVLLFTALIEITCSKIDKTAENIISSQDLFFSAQSSNEKSVIALKEFLKRENLKFHFTNELVKRIGIPMWNKCLVFHIGDEPLFNRSNGGGNESGTVVYVPYVRPGEGFVNALMMFQMTSLDTSWRGLCDWQYQDLGHDTTDIDSTHWISRDAFNAFATMDREVFGYSDFEITDGRIFGRQDNDTLIATLDPTDTHDRNSILQRSNTLSTTLICHTIRICQQGSNRNKGVSLGTNCYETERCTVIYTLGSGWGIGEPNAGGAGGSGNGGGYVPPICPGNASRNTTIPECSRGWNPYGGWNPPPIPSDSLIAENLKRLYIKGQSKSDSLFTEAMNDHLERTFTYLKTPFPDTISKYYRVGDIYRSSPTLAENYIAIWHSHQDEGSSNMDQSFDGPDIFKLYYFYLINQGFPVSIITTRNYIYAAVVTDPQKFIAYIRSLTGTTILKQVDEELDNLHQSAMNACTDPSCTWQKKSEKGVMAITANNDSDISGIKIFRSSRTTINFTLLNP